MLSQFAVEKSCGQVSHIVMFPKARLFTLGTTFLIIEGLGILHHSCEVGYDAAITVVVLYSIGNFDD